MMTTYICSWCETEFMVRMDKGEVPKRRECCPACGMESYELRTQRLPRVGQAPLATYMKTKAASP